MVNSPSSQKSGYQRATVPVKRMIAGVLLGRLLRRVVVSNHVWIVAFHRVDDLAYPNPLTCGITQFEECCELLARTFRVVPLSQQLDRLGREDCGGTLSITFDDGYLDNFEHAAPILERLGLPATFFVATGFIGTDAVAWWDRELPDTPKWMSWDQVRSLHSRGFDIGCHTVNHADLGSLAEKDAERELLESRQRLCRELNTEIDLFAYPYGGPEHMNAENLLIVKNSGLRCSLSCHGGVNAINSDPFSLRRIPINSAGGETAKDIAYHLLRNMAPL
ncbi:polysaccharide deacetylase family protein [Thiocapsa marina]|uniref:Polysaccharide deacetylase n=1 Tax=Thiocapsa marina 5811 TaxID=768671 RepID=F9UIJ3_9GAMM|nr:polysaccharide deacetylase family protein [Thiocapsa marina]EGV15975.1 polysaccharide deacetylase [Thiocapsa marina 5811]